MPWIIVVLLIVYTGICGLGATGGDYTYATSLLVLTTTLAYFAYRCGRYSRRK